MKKIKDLDIKMTYRVGLSNVEVPDKVYKGLGKIAEGTGISDDEATATKDKDILEAYEWLMNNIEEGDAHSWEYEVDIED